MLKRVFFVVTTLLVAVFNLNADPVSWTFKLVDKGNNEIELQAAARVESGWHLYDVNIPEGGPNATEISFDELKGATKIGSLKAIDGKLVKSFDSLFDMEVGYYSNQATFAQRFKITDKNIFSLKGDIRAQACNDSECTPHVPTEFSFSAKDLTAALAGTAVAEGPATETSPIDSISAITPATAVDVDADLWAPVIKEISEYGAEGNVTDMSLIWVFIAGFGGGLVALMTPCVWPMIPMTVSFFLKRNKKNKKKAISEAIIYGIGIIVIYVALGVIITGIFGASALNDLSTSAIFNLLFFALLVVFAISFLGAFDLSLPASWTNKMDSKADSTTGVISIFFMAFTLALVSFSCTGPIIGTLLVESAASGTSLAPAIGMLGFALALAIPFSLFAIFPSWLESMPKSGGWLNSVKVVLGFLELALALKFLSVADGAYKWGILDREVFLVLWIIIFTLLGLYLLGKIKFAHDDDLKYVSVPRTFFAIITLSFAVYLVPGLWGAPLKAVSAFTPPMWTQDFNLYTGVVHAKFDDYDAGMDYAKRANKPVIIDFSGYGCVNCRNMEAAVWTDPRVKQKLENDYVLITLMVDDKERLPEVIEVQENGKTTKLKTIGDKWSYLQRHKFATNSQPYYVLLDHAGKPIGPSYAYDKDIEKYLQFLQTGINNFKKEQEQK